MNYKLAKKIALKRCDEQNRVLFHENISPVFWLEIRDPIPVDLPVEDQVDLIFKKAYIKEASNRTVQFYGFKNREELVGKLLPVIWTPECINRNHVTHKFFQEFVREDYQIIDIEVPGTNQVGEDKWFLNNLKGIVDNGRLTDILGSQIDITDRKRAEKERNSLINDLQKSIREIRTLRGILPLCSFCKKIRDDRGYWEQVD